MNTKQNQYLKPGARVLWCPPAKPAGTMPPPQFVIVDSLDGDLIKVDLLDHPPIITYRWVFASELYPDPHDAA